MAILLKDPTPNITRIGTFEEIDYSLAEENLGTLFHIVRSQLYSDKLGAVIREYSTNADDAHTTIDQTQPVEIRLPTKINPTLRIRDFGEGLSLKKLASHFLSIGASDKRESPLLNGKLGIGCKAGFAYTDAFDVCSWHEGHHIAGTCYIDESRKGKMAITTQRPMRLDEPHGLEIIIPILEEDFSKCIEKTQEILSAFANPPKLLLAEEEIKVVSLVTGCPVRIHYGGSSQILSHNVAYPLNHEEVGVPIPKGYQITLEMPKGSFAFAASREAIEYIKETREGVQNHIKEHTTQFQKEAQKLLEKFDNPWTANVAAWRKIRLEQSISGPWNTLQLLGQLRWKTQALTTKDNHLEYVLLEASLKEGKWVWSPAQRKYLSPEKSLIVFPASPENPITLGATRKTIDPLKCPWVNPAFDRAEKEGFTKILFVLHTKNWSPSRAAETGKFPILAPQSCTMVLTIPQKGEARENAKEMGKSKPLTQKEIKHQQVQGILKRTILITEASQPRLIWTNPDEREKFPERKVQSLSSRGKPPAWWKNLILEKFEESGEAPTLLLKPRKCEWSYGAEGYPWIKRLFGENFIVLKLKESLRGNELEETREILKEEMGIIPIEDYWKERRPKHLVCAHIKLRNLIEALGREAWEIPLLQNLYAPAPEETKYSRDSKLPPEEWADDAQVARETKIWNKLLKKFPLLDHCTVCEKSLPALRLYLKLGRKKSQPKPPQPNS